MVKGTDSVLEALDDLGPVPLGKLDLEISEVPKKTIARALEQLEDKGYVEKNEQYSSYYEITEKGRGYLAGEVDASEDDDDDS